MLSLPEHLARIVLTIGLLPHARCFGKRYTVRPNRVPGRWNRYQVLRCALHNADNYYLAARMPSLVITTRFSVPSLL